MTIYSHPYADYSSSVTSLLKSCNNEQPENAVKCMAFHALSGVYCDNKNVAKLFFGNCRSADYHAELAFFKTGLKHKLPLPQLISFGTLDGDIPFIISRLSTGTMLQDAVPHMSISELDSIFLQLQALLNKIHSIPGDGFGRTGGKLYSQWPQFLESEVKAGLEILSDKEIIDHKDLRTLNNFFYTCLDNEALQKKSPVLVHGDFCEKNILVKREVGGWRIDKLIDYGFSIYGDPLFDMPRADNMFHRLKPAGMDKNHDHRLIFFYEVCDYIMYLKNTFAINDSGFHPYFKGKVFQYPDCKAQYINAHLSDYCKTIDAMNAC